MGNFDRVFSRKLRFCSFMWKNSKRTNYLAPFFFSYGNDDKRWGCVGRVPVVYLGALPCPLPIIDLSQPLTFERY